MAAPAARSEFLTRRRTGIGGSDIPILAGISPYHRGPHDVYLEKIGEDVEVEPTWAMEVGQVIEDTIAVLYTRKTGRQVVRANVLARHPDLPWAIGNLDRKVRGERRLVEIKNRRTLSKAEGLPADVECQVQWYLGVTRYPVADVAILVGGQELRIVEIRADEAYFQDLLVIASDFWFNHVQKGVPPEIDGSESAARYLASVYPWHRRDADLVPADATLEEMAGELREARTALAEAEGRKRTVENAIKAVLGETPGVIGDGWTITWKRTADYPRVDWQGVAREFESEASAFTDAVHAHTQTIEGTRQFRAYFPGEPTE